METAPALPHLVIVHPDNFPTHEESDQLGSRAIVLANDYLQGRPLYLQSASLKGPFGRTWKNPWLKEAKKRELSLGCDAGNARLGHSITSPTHDTVQNILSISSSESIDGDGVFEGRQRPQMTTNALHDKRHPHENSATSRSAAHFAPTRRLPVQRTESLGSQSTKAASKPALERRLRRAKQKPPLEKCCAWCHTDASYQWRKGPLGPGTLCSSCGAKWTYQQKKAREVDIAEQGTDASSRMTAAVALGPGGPNPEREVQDDGQSVLISKHGHICKEMFPDADMRYAVVSSRAQDLEALVSGEALRLRGRPCPTMQSWDKTPSKAAPGSNLLLRSSIQHNGASSPIQPGARFNDAVKKDESNSPAAKAWCMKRKVLTFDTPQAGLRKASAVEEYAKDEPTRSMQDPIRVVEAEARNLTPRSGNRSAQRNIALGQLAKTSAHFRKRPPNSHGAELISQGGARGDGGERHGSSPSTRKSPLPWRFSPASAHTAVLEAQAAFQEGLRWMDVDTTDSCISTVASETASRHHSPIPYPAQRQRSYSPAAICTQDLFDGTLQFGSPSPAKIQPGTQSSTIGLLGKATPRITPKVRVHTPINSPPSSQAGSNDKLRHTGDVTATEESMLPSLGVESHQGEHGPFSDRPSPPLFLSTTKLINRTPMAQGDGGIESLRGHSQGLNVDEVIAEAGSFLNTWRL